MSSATSMLLTAWILLFVHAIPRRQQLKTAGNPVFCQEATTTSACYRLYALSGGPPYRPGLIRDPEHGTAIDVEVWRIPLAEFGSFVAAIPEPLGIGKIELSDGRWLPGFICEGHAVTSATEITALGSWRRYQGPN